MTLFPQIFGFHFACYRRLLQEFGADFWRQCASQTCLLMQQGALWLLIKLNSCCATGTGCSETPKSLITWFANTCAVLFSPGTVPNKKSIRLLFFQKLVKCILWKLLICSTREILSMSIQLSKESEKRDWNGKTSVQLSKLDNTFSLL